MIKTLWWLVPLTCTIPSFATDLGPSATGYRTFDGTGNHPSNNGSFQSPYSFLKTPPAYGDQLTTPAGSTRPSPKAISDALFGASPTVANTELSDLMSYFGQFIANDIALTESSNNETMSFTVPQCELVDNNIECSGSVPFNFSRAIAVPSSPSQPRRVVNFQTSFIDGSVIYGPNNATAALLRTFSNGLLKTEFNPDSGEEMLPFANNDTIFQMMESAHVTNTTKLFLAGDTRANMQPALQTLHTLFAREHNSRAAKLKEDNPSLCDEQIFQRARAWVIALLQKITYQQYLPTLLGTQLPAYQGYDPTKDPSLDHFFVIAAFRFGHSSISPLILRLDEEGLAIPEGHLLLRDHFYNTDALVQSQGSLDDILRGLTFQASQVIDTIMTDEVRTHLPKNQYDLAAINIARGRDVGLTSYVNARVAFGLSVPTSFQDINTTSEIQDQLASVYNDVADVDAYVGGLAEQNASPSYLGPLFTASLIEQFTRLRDADRFWYERDQVLQPGELEELNAWDLGRVVVENSGIDKYPSNPFLIYNSAFMGGINGNTVSNSESSISIQLAPNVLSLSVKPVSDSQLEFQLCASFSGGWMAIGFHPSAVQMAGADIIMARQINGQWQVQDYHAIDEVVPVLDTQQDVSSVSDATAVCGATQGVTFRRLANTGDVDDVPIVKDSYVYLIYAYVPLVNTFDYHGSSSRGGAPVKLWSALPYSSPGVLTTSTSNSVNNVLIYHGSIMFICYSVIFPIAVFLIRYMTTFSAKYVLVHRMLMTFGSMAAVLAVASVFAASGNGYLLSLKVHAVFGLALFCNMLLNLFLGTLVMQHWSFVRRNQRWIRIIHRSNGWILFVGGWVNSALGLVDIQGTNLLSAYIVWLVFVIFVFLLFGEFGFMKRFYGWYLKRRSMGSSMSSLNSGFGGKGKRAVLTFSWSEVNARVAQGAQWLVISGNIYDVGEFIDQHPGGKQLIKESIGTDTTRAFYGTISSTQDFANDAGDEKGLLGIIPKTLTRRRNQDNPKPSTPEANALLTARPKNLHSNVAMHRLQSMFVGRVKDYDEGDEDDLMALVNQVLGKQDIGTEQKRRESAASSRSSTNLAPEEAQHEARRLQATNDLLDDTEFKLFSLKTITPGLKEQYYRNLRLLSKSLVVKQDANDKVYRFRFAFERPNHALVTIPGDTFEFLIFSNIERDQNEESSSSVGVSRFYTPIHVKQIGHLDLIIKVYENGKMTRVLNRLKVGDSVRIRGPIFHKTQLNPNTISGCYHRAVLIAGGSGITPMLLILEYYQRMKRVLESEGVKPTSAEMPIELILITVQHSVNDLILDKELERMAQDSDGFIKIVKCISQEPPTGVAFEGFVGRLDEANLRELIPFAPNSTIVAPSFVTRRMSIAAETRRASVDDKQYSSNVKSTVHPSNIRSTAVIGNNEFVITESPLESAKPTTKRDYHLFVCGPLSFNDSIENILLNQIGFGADDVTIL